MVRQAHHLEPVEGVPQKAGHVLPETPIQQALAGIFAEVLGGIFAANAIGSMLLRSRSDSCPLT